MPNEYDIIETIRNHQRRLPASYEPVGDDVASLPLTGRRGEKKNNDNKKKEKVILKCDMLVEETDVPHGMGWRRAARKAVATCVSDFAAKGVRPTAFMVSLGLPRNVREGQVDAIASGLADAAQEWGVRLIGGDTNQAGALIIDCLMVGFASAIVTRRGASPGEFVVVTGTFGKTAAGLRILLEGASAEPGFRRGAVSSVYLPSPKLEVGLAIARYLSSSIDSSDGLAISLHSLSEMSGVGISLERLPRSRGLERFASTNGYAADDLALYGGEEYEIVGTIAAGKFPRAAKKARSLGGDLIVIGKTTKGGGILLPDGKAVEKRGWIHLS
jgi:thiamine-monophosphate kinase